MDRERPRRLSRGAGRRSVGDTIDTSAKLRKNYGTLTEPEEEEPMFRRRISEPDHDAGDNVPDVSIDGALNRIKTYRTFFYLSIIPMILAFAFSDLIVDSLNFLELLPMGLECKTIRTNHNGENIWIPCSKNKICNGRSNDDIVRNKDGIAKYRKSSDDYYSLVNWTESMDIECKNDLQVGALGSVAFIGMAIGSIVGALLSAKYGRKVIYVGGLVLTTLPLLVLTFEPHYITGLISLLVYGIGVFPRMTIGYVYALELTPEGATRTLGMLMFVGE